LGDDQKHGVGAGRAEEREVNAISTNTDFFLEEAY
jgi:hypothetical protein